MPSFEYTGYDNRGRMRKGLATGASLKEARERLAEEGLLAETLTPIRRRLKFPSEIRAMVYRELGALIKAGMPLDRALALLTRSPDLGESRVLLAGIRDRILEGRSLAQAFMDSTDACTPFEIAILQAAERSATMDTMLARLAEFIETQDKLRDSVRSALIYPVLVLTFGVCSAMIILGFLMPRMLSALTAGGATLPGLTRFVLALGNMFSHGAFWGAVAALAVAGALFFRRLRRDEAWRHAWDRRVFRLPIYGRGYALLANVRFASTLSILVSGGVSLIEGLAMAGRATGSPWLARLAADEADRVRHGKNLADAVQDIPPLSETLPGWIRVGEAGGGMAEILESAGQRYRDHWVRFVDRRMRLLEPLLVLVMGAFVLLIALAILLPIFSMSQAFGG